MQDINEEKDKKFKEKLCVGEMSNERKEIIEKLIRKYEDIIEYDEEKLGKIKLVKHEIEIKENQEPIVQKRYKETDEKGKFIKKEVEQLGKIRESKSPWASPVTLAKKKGADYRFCKIINIIITSGNMVRPKHLE
jgi:hypothetical protein